MDPLRRGLLTGAFVVALAGVMWFFFFRGGEEQRVRAQLDRLATAMRFSAGTNPVIYLARVRDVFADVLADDVSISAPELPGGVRGRADLANATASLTRRFRTLDVELRDVEVKLDDAVTTAQVTASAVLAGGEHAEGTSRERRPVTFLMRKTEGVWRVTSVTVWARETRLEGDLPLRIALFEP